ncbi:MAG: FkbM family methyltransferase [Sulfolobales archaeon]|nr:FkbM family methyltransferase [Sulfolobales archaeon]
MVAIEPNIEIVRSLLNNLYMARVKNVRVLPVAISNRDRFAELFVSSNAISLSLKREYVSAVGYKVRRVVKVPVLTLSSLLYFLEINKVDLLLLDVEGLSYEILTSSIELLKQGIFKRIKIDVSDYLYSRDFAGPLAIIALLRKFNYKIFVTNFSLYAILQSL